RRQDLQSHVSQRLLEGAIGLVDHDAGEQWAVEPRKANHRYLMSGGGQHMPGRPADGAAADDRADRDSGGGTAPEGRAHARYAEDGADTDHRVRGGDDDPPRRGYGGLGFDRQSRPIETAIRD